MDWTMTVVYLVCATFVIYVAGLLCGWIYETTHRHGGVPDQASRPKV
jgi:hypothetical protein